MLAVFCPACYARVCLCVQIANICRKCRPSQGVSGHAQIIKACRAPGPLAMSALSDEELALLEAMMERLGWCAKAAFEVWSPYFTLRRRVKAALLTPCLCICTHTFS